MMLFPLGRFSLYIQPLWMANDLRWPPGWPWLWPPIFTSCPTTNPPALPEHLQPGWTEATEIPPYGQNNLLPHLTGGAAKWKKSVRSDPICYHHRCF